MKSLIQLVGSLVCMSSILCMMFPIQVAAMLIVIALGVIIIVLAGIYGTLSEQRKPQSDSSYKQRTDQPDHLSDNLE